MLTSGLCLLHAPRALRAARRWPDRHAQDGGGLGAKAGQALSFVPYVGAIASAIPGLLAALAQSPRHLLYAAIVNQAVHVVEGYLVQPLVMRRAVEVKPAALLVCAQVLTGLFWVERRLGKPPPVSGKTPSTLG